MHMQRGNEVVHYIGFTRDMAEVRINRHRKGGSKYTKRMRDKGFEFDLGYVWEGATMKDEYRLKRELTPIQKCRLCRHCKNNPDRC